MTTFEANYKVITNLIPKKTKKRNLYFSDYHRKIPVNAIKMGMLLSRIILNRYHMKTTKFRKLNKENLLYDYDNIHIE